MIYNIYNKNNKLRIILILILIIIILLLIFNISHTDTFESIELDKTFTEINPIETVNNTYPKENTKLYGSLFLDNLNEQIIKLTNPPIEYYKKRIELNNYSDIIL